MVNNISNVILRFILVFFMFLVIGCATIERENQPTAANIATDEKSNQILSKINLPPGSHPKESCGKAEAITYQPTSEEMERDNIYQLLAYGVVYKDWQTKSWSNEGKPARGYNIGSILIHEKKPLGEQIVCWARNSVIITENGTQHGEVRLITNYLNNAETANLKDDFKLYTTLEPCIMCGGMMTLQSLGTTLYGQTDPDYGDGIQRLEVNTHTVGGFCPYPRGVYSNGSSLKIRHKIDEAYQLWRENPNNRGLTAWLITEGARKLFEEAVGDLIKWKVKYSMNQVVLDEAIDFLINTVPEDYEQIPYTVGCSGK